MTIAVDLGRKANKQTKLHRNDPLAVPFKDVQRFPFHAEFWLPWQPKRKTLKILSKTMVRFQNNLLRMVLGPWMTLFQNSSNYFDLLKNMAAKGVASYSYVNIGKNFKIFLSRTSRPRALIFDDVLLLLANDLAVFLQGSHRLEKYLNILNCLEKSLRIKFALKSTGKNSKALKSP